METHYETATYRSFYPVSIAVAITRETAENVLEPGSRSKTGRPEKIMYDSTKENFTRKQYLILVKKEISSLPSLKSA